MLGQTSFSSLFGGVEVGPKYKVDTEYCRKKITVNEHNYHTHLKFHVAVSTLINKNKF
jgi:hypothetical protein